MYAYIIVFFILALAIGYAGWRLHKLFSPKADPCKNCQGCLQTCKFPLKQKKHDEKFGWTGKKH